MKICFPTDLALPYASPLRLASNYRDYDGDPHARLTELVDPFLRSACYVPRFFHAPDNGSESAGVAAGGYLEYALTVEPGSFILGFQHCFTGLANADSAANPPVRSSFKFQVTDVERQYSWFDKPVPEAWLLQDAPSENSLGLVGGSPFVLNPSPRLLPAPYPVALPGVFRIEFWNALDVLNTGVRLTLIAAVPNPDLVGGGV